MPLPPPRILAAALAAACLGLLAAALAAQPVPSPAPAPVPPAAAAPAAGAADFGESIEVDVVSVEVFVTDRAGKAVAGLGRGDFELQVDGKAVAITNFYAGTSASATAAPGAPAAGEPATAAAPASQASDPAGTPEDRRLNLIVFVDNLTLTPEARNRAIESLSAFFRSGLRPGDRVLLASYDGQALKLRRPPPATSRRPSRRSTRSPR